MATQPTRRRGAVAPQARKTVKCTVVLDVNTHARLAAAAALRGVDRSTFAAQCIADGLRGIVVFDKGKPGDNVDSSGEGRSAGAA